MPTLSACLIVRNEGKNLDSCLEALAPFVDEICVLDTGSTDDTVQVATRFEARIGTRAWDDDFAAARNACIELATSDWILMVDADELLDPESAEGLRPLLDLPTPQAYLVWIDNLEGGFDGQGRPTFHSIGVPRLFRNRPEIRYERPVHESILASLNELHNEPLEHSHLRFVHHGYSPEAIREGDKLARNHKILTRHVQSDSGDLFSAYKLGLSCAALGDSAGALQWMEQTWSRAMNLADGPRNALPFLPLLGAELVKQKRLTGDMQGAQATAQEARSEYPTVSEVLFELGEVERACGRLESASEAYGAARQCEPWSDIYTGNPGTRGALAMCGLARLSALGGDLELAAFCVSQALELEPTNWEARTIKARLASVRGEEQVAWSELSELLAEAPSCPHVQLFAAEMAWSRRELETARGFWNGLLRDPEHRSLARAWLCIAQLSEGDLAGAVRDAKDLVACDLPEAGAVCVLAAVAEEVPKLDGRFEPAALAGEIRAWLAELGQDPNSPALTAFREGAGLLQPLLGEASLSPVT
jgi:Flp pilus assembly protein TadD